MNHHQLLSKQEVQHATEVFSPLPIIVVIPDWMPIGQRTGAAIYSGISMDNDNLEVRLISILEEHPWFMKALEVVDRLELPQWCIGGGVIRNIVFDNLSDTIGTLPRDVDVAPSRPIG